MFSSNVNVLPVWKILNSCKSKGLKKFIYFSTIHVYGKSKNQLFSEHNNLNPKNIYGLTHSLSEQIVNFYNENSNIDCINIRLSNSYGEPIFHESKSWNLVVNDLVNSAFNNKKIILRGDGKAIRDFIHVTDIADMHVLAANNLLKSSSSNIFNCGYGSGYSVKEVITEMENIVKNKLRVEIGPRRPKDIAVSVANSDKFKKKINWKPRFNNLNIILSSALNWEKNNL